MYSRLKKALILVLVVSMIINTSQRVEIVYAEKDVMESILIGIV